MSWIAALTNYPVESLVFDVSTKSKLIKNLLIPTQDQFALEITRLMSIFPQYLLRNVPNFKGNLRYSAVQNYIMELIKCEFSSLKPTIIKECNPHKWNARLQQLICLIGQPDLFMGCAVPLLQILPNLYLQNLPDRRQLVQKLNSSPKKIDQLFLTDLIGIKTETSSSEIATFLLFLGLHRITGVNQKSLPLWTDVVRINSWINLQNVS